MGDRRAPPPIPPPRFPPAHDNTYSTEEQSPAACALRVAPVLAICTQVADQTWRCLAASLSSSISSSLTAWYSRQLSRHRRTSYGDERVDAARSIPIGLSRSPLRSCEVGRRTCPESSGRYAAEREDISAEIMQGGHMLDQARQEAPS